MGTDATDVFSLKLEELKNKYASSLDSLELSFPGLSSAESQKNYFPDEIGTVPISRVDEAIPYSQPPLAKKSAPPVSSPESNVRPSISEEVTPPESFEKSVRPSISEEVTPPESFEKSVPSVGELSRVEEIQEEEEILQSTLEAAEGEELELEIPPAEISKPSTEKKSYPKFVEKSVSVPYAERGKIHQKPPKTILWLSRSARNRLGELIGKAEKPRLLFLSAIACSMIGFAVWFFIFRDVTLWDLPFLHNEPIGLGVSGDKLLVLNPAAETLYFVSIQTGFLAGATQLPCPQSTGLALNRQILWCASASQGQIQRYAYTYDASNDGAYVLKRAYSMGSVKLGSLYANNDYLWGLDLTGGIVYQYLIVQSLTGTSLTPVSHFKLPEPRVVGLYISNDVLWTFDPETRRILRFRLTDSGPQPLDSLNLSAYLRRSGPVGGFNTDGHTLWILTQSPPQIHHVDLDTLPHQRE